ncbi:hypothetical protein HanPSC8_Chr11g0495031 [Helianthus annuus]|nr:hypothetical protein HanPSC8_Chr11g0495031 [Helianthus annuus]
MSIFRDSVTSLRRLFTERSSVSALVDSSVHNPWLLFTSIEADTSISIATRWQLKSQIRVVYTKLQHRSESRQSRTSNSGFYLSIARLNSDLHLRDLNSSLKHRIQ